MPENEQDKFRLYSSLVNIRPVVKANDIQVIFSVFYELFQCSEPCHEQTYDNEENILL